MDKYKVTIETYNKFAQQYQDKFMDLALYNDTYDKFCKLIDKEHAEILEIACGPGNITKYLLKKHADYNILAIDLSLNMIQLAKINNPKAKFQLMDCRDLDKINKKYDAVINGFGLPYISAAEVTELIKNVSNILKSNGVFYLSAMEGDYSKSGYKGSSYGGKDMAFTYYYDEDFINNALIKNGFKISEIQRFKYPEQQQKYNADLIIIATKI